MLPADESSVAGGVSSFGYAGTIAHTVICFEHSTTSDVVAERTLPWLRKVAFAWLSQPHPMARRRLPYTGSDVVFRSAVSGPLYALVSDHVVRERVIFPGAGYLELARAVACVAVGSSSVALQGVFFLQPLAVEAVGLHVECAVSADRFEIRSGEGDASPLIESAAHCSGSFAPSTQMGVAHRPRVSARELALSGADWRVLRRF